MVESILQKVGDIMTAFDGISDISGSINDNSKINQQQQQPFIHWHAPPLSRSHNDDTQTDPAAATVGSDAVNNNSAVIHNKLVNTTSSGANKDISGTDSNKATSRKYGGLLFCNSLNPFSSSTASKKVNDKIVNSAAATTPTKARSDKPVTSSEVTAHMMLKVDEEDVGNSSSVDSKIHSSSNSDSNINNIDPSLSLLTPSHQDKDMTTPTAAGRLLMSQFQDFYLQPPKDHVLKLQWDSFIEDEISSRILKKNRKIIFQELKRNCLKHSFGSIKALEDLLRRQLLSRAEVKQALRSAVRLQAGRHTTLLLHKEPPKNVSSSSNNSSVKQPKVERLDRVSSGIDGNNSEGTSYVDVVGNSDRIQQKLLNNNNDDITIVNELVLSHWALDTAFGSILKVPAPRMGKPIARSKDQISAMATDKHERALISNVISPQDIGVTYDMIGGLDDVKEMLRQCITYPLKYPRLYQEGVAAEAVKGVLLFGPPGTGR